MLVSQVRVQVHELGVRVTGRDALKLYQTQKAAWKHPFYIELGSNGSHHGDDGSRSNPDTDEALAYTKQDLDALATLLRCLQEAKHPPKAILVFYFSTAGPRMQRLLANCESLPHLSTIRCDNVRADSYVHNPCIELRGSAREVKITALNIGRQWRGASLALNAFDAVRTGALVPHDRAVDISIKYWNQDYHAAAWAMVTSGRVDELRIVDWQTCGHPTVEDTPSPFVADALATPYVTRLTLEWDNPGYTMSPVLLRALRTTTALRELTLMEPPACYQAPGRVCDLAALIAENKCSFTSLKLVRPDFFREHGSGLLTDALCKNTHITELDIDDGSADHEYSQLYVNITRLLQSNRTIRSIGLGSECNKITYITDSVFGIMDALEKTNQGIYAMRMNIYIEGLDLVTKFVAALRKNDQIIDIGSVAHGFKGWRIAEVDAIIDRNRRIRTMAAASAISICTRRASRDNPLRGALVHLVPVILGLDEHTVKPSAARVARAREERRKEQKETQLVESKKVEN